MISKEKVFESLKKVIDPEIGLPITELNMVKDIEINGEEVKVTIALTIAECPMADTLQNDVTQVLMKEKDVSSVKVELTSMTKEQLDALKESLKNRAANNAPPGKTPPGIEKLDKKGIRNIIAIVSGKGGVGKSFVTSMIATELKKQGYEVGVLDADITGPSIAKIFGMTKRPVMGENGIIPSTTKSGIKVISVNLLIDDARKATIWRGPIISNVIRQLYAEVDWGELHYLIIDLPPGTSDAPLTVYQSIPLDGIVAVTTPQDLALMIVSKSTDMAKTMNVEILGVIENMSYFKCEHCEEKLQIFGKSGVERAASILRAPVLGQIPIDPKIAELSDKGEIEEYDNEVIGEIVKRVREYSLKASEAASNEIPIAWKMNEKEEKNKLKMYGK